MPTWQRTYLAACCAMIGYSLAYVLCDYGRWPRLAYFPYERSFGVVTELSSSIPMLYLGTVLWGLLGALGAAALAWVLAGVRSRPVSDRWLQLFGGWAVVGFGYGGLYYTWALWPF